MLMLKGQMVQSLLIDQHHHLLYLLRQQLMMPLVPGGWMQDSRCFVSNVEKGAAVPHVRPKCLLVGVRRSYCQNSVSNVAQTSAQPL